MKMSMKANGTMNMKQLTNSKKQSFVLLLVFLIYAVVIVATQVMQADDFFWYYVFDYDELARYRMPNGRYVSNILTHLIVRYPVARYLVMVGLIMGTLWLLGSTPLHQKDDFRSYWVGLFLFVTIPIRATSEVFYYLSAFVIYVLPMFCVLLYLRMAFSVCKAQAPPKMGWRSVLAFALGLAGAMCLESMTIYACFLAVFFLLWSIFACKRRGLLMHIAYTLGTAIGTAAMFLNPNYYSIATGDDQQGCRYFEFNFSDIFAKLYQEVMPKFAKPIPIVHILIVFGLYVLYVKADRSGWDRSRRRYAKLSAAMVVIYAAYSAFTALTLNFQETTWAMRVYAVQTALVFLDIVAILYLVYLLLPRQTLFHVGVYLSSATLHSLLFCVVGPVSARCFYTNYLFWALCAVEIFLSADVKKTRIPLSVTKIVACVACFSMMYCVSMNKYASFIQIKHLREQITKENIRVYEIIDLPYAMFDGGSCVENPYYDPNTGRLLPGFTEEELPATMDKIDMRAGTIQEIYFRLWAEYYSYDLNPSTYRTVHFSLLDYNTEDRSTVASSAAE